MLPGTVLLANGGEAQVRKILILKLFLLLDFLENEPNQPGSSALRTISRFNGAELTKYGSSFFWYFARLCYKSVEETSALPPNLRGLLLVHLFDSFFPALRDGDSVSLEDADLREIDIQLPCLEVGLPRSAEPRLLARTSSSEILAHGRAGELRIDLSAPGDYTLRRIQIAPSAQVLFSIHSLLADPVAEQKIARLSDADGGEFAKQLKLGLELIESADPTVARQIHREIRWYFPIQTPNKAKVHNSFTVSILDGAIFLSESYSHVSLAEALVHEFRHTELWRAMTIEPHLRGPDEPRLYSPWRPDPRPLLGLYHGIYVFTGLLEFFFEAGKRSTLQPHHAQFRRRKEFIYFQLRTALSQVPRGSLTPRGQQFIESIRQIVDYYGELLNLRPKPVEENQRQHLQDWLVRNPEFEQYVMPAPGLWAGSQLA
ncbi:MAG: HEXXH motif-containing putative peptide modification protein [Acidobacteria bacterium]|nr:HEXXH motif-containing putative peptide modification protein [Acidobacteriota bacterium]